MRTQRNILAWLAVAVLVVTGCARQPATGGNGKEGSPPGTSSVASGTVQIEVTDAGFVPASVTVPKDQPIHLTFVRKTNQTCAVDVVFPSLSIKRDLPLDQPVDVEIPPQPAGTIAYACGMDMVKGSVVVE